MSVNEFQTTHPDAEPPESIRSPEGFPMRWKKGIALLKIRRESSEDNPRERYYFIEGELGFAVVLFPSGTKINTLMEELQRSNGMPDANVSVGRSQAAVWSGGGSEMRLLSLVDRFTGVSGGTGLDLSDIDPSEELQIEGPVLIMSQMEEPIFTGNVVFLLILLIDGVLLVLIETIGKKSREFLQSVQEIHTNREIQQLKVFAKHDMYLKFLCIALLVLSGVLFLVAAYLGRLGLAESGILIFFGIALGKRARSYTRFTRQIQVLPVSDPRLVPKRDALVKTWNRIWLAD